MFQNPDHSDILFVSGAVQSKREDSQREDSCRTINRKEGKYEVGGYIGAWRWQSLAVLVLKSSCSFRTIKRGGGGNTRLQSHV